MTVGPPPITLGRYGRLSPSSLIPSMRSVQQLSRQNRPAYPSCGLCFRLVAGAKDRSTETRQRNIVQPIFISSAYDFKRIARQEYGRNVLRTSSNAFVRKISYPATKTTVPRIYRKEI